MSNRTTQVKRTFSNTIGAGVRSLFNGNQHYFILEHQGGSNSMAPGFSKQFIVEFVEIGRSKSCNFRFGEADATVSRVHASIHKEDNKYVITHRSETNPTMVNGNYVQDRWFLNNGDTIQLSKTGPKLNFIIPVNNATKTIGMTRRLSLFAQQALGPIKRLILTGAILLILLIAGLSYYLTSRITVIDFNIEDQKKVLLVKLDSLNKERKILQDTLEKQMQSQSKELKGQMSKTTIQDKRTAFEELEKYYEKDVYYCAISDLKVKMPNGETIFFESISLSGTAFLTNEGLLITARHCIEPWLFESFLDDIDLMHLNHLIINGGQVDCNFNFYGPGSENSFKIPYNRFRTNDRNDNTIYHQFDDGITREILKINSELCNDIAYAKVNKKGSIKIDHEGSQNLALGQTVYSVGYPFSVGAGQRPIYSTNTVSYRGLFNECILITDSNTDSGSSGGPLFAKKGNTFVVVGVVTGGIGNKIGNITPISAINF